jgi:hypothetical protein
MAMAWKERRKNLGTNQAANKGRIRQRLLLIGILLLVLIAGCIQFRRMYLSQPLEPGVYNSREQTQAGDQLNISYGVTLSDKLTKSSQQDQVAYLKQVKAAGLKEIRYDLSWNVVEAQKGKYDWSKFDNVIKNVNAAGLKSIVMIARTPAWAAPTSCRGTTFCAPADKAAFAKFAGLAASRYKDNNVIAWEIWNEPNIVEFWKPMPNPNQYARLLQGAYESIKKANPSATVLVGGLSGNSVNFNGDDYIDPRSFLGQVYAADTTKPFDGIAYHPYTGTGSTASKGEYNGWLKVDTGKYTIRSVMIDNGDASKQIWITEYGVPSDGPKAAVTDLNATSQPKNVDHVSIQVQDQILKEMIENIRSRSWIRHFDWYTLRDDASPSSNAGGAYGLYYYNGQAKPAQSTLKQASEKASSGQNH